MKKDMVRYLMCCQSPKVPFQHKNTVRHYSKPSHLYLILEFFFLLVSVWRTKVKYTWTFIFT